MKSRTILMSAVILVLLVSAAAVLSVSAAPPAAPPAPKAKFSTAVAFDKTPALRDMARSAASRAAQNAAPDEEPREIRPERGPVAEDRGFAGDGAIQESGALQAATASSAAAIAGPIANFEGVSNQDNFNLFGFRVNPPDPVGDVGPNHYVEMVNLAFAVYDKQGNLLLGPLDTGTLWSGFPVEDCTDPSGDPIVVYDQLVDRWILTQFTTRGFDDPALPFYDCVAISQTGDPTGAYYRYAFITQPDTVAGGYFFPDYPSTACGPIRISSPPATSA